MQDPCQQSGALHRFKLMEVEGRRTSVVGRSDVGTDPVRSVYPLRAGDWRGLHDSWNQELFGIRVSVAFQFTSQVFPPSSEKACSKWHEFGVMSEITNRTRMARPSRVS